MNLFWKLIFSQGYAVAQLVEALRYMPEGRRFVSSGVNGICN
jgi:2-keto-3-deoxy-L-rhamnonate aldolase RhmA